jgi:hypothetical protein
MAANEQWTKVDVGGKTAKLRVDYFDTPMKQPKAKKGRVADRTGCRPWPVARPLLEHLRTDVIPDLERDLGRPPRVLELGSGVGLLGVGLAMTTDCDVTLTDPDIETNFSDGTSMSTLEWLQRNIELNVASARAATAARRASWILLVDEKGLEARLPKITYLAGNLAGVAPHGQATSHGQSICDARRTRSQDNLNHRLVSVVAVAAFVRPSPTSGVETAANPRAAARSAKSPSAPWRVT